MKPIVQALLLADHVYTDRATGKKIIAGTFDRVMIGSVTVPEKQLPDGTKRAQIPGGFDAGCPTVYINLTDVVDNTKITLQFVNVTQNKVLFGAEIAVRCPDRFIHVELDFQLPPLRAIVSEVGTYSLDVLWQGEIIGSHRVTTSPFPVQSNEGESHGD